MLVKLDDDVIARYQQMADDLHQPLATLLERQLSRFSAFPPTVRVLPLGRDSLQQVESLLGGGQIQSPQVLVDRVRSYSAVKLGEITLDLSSAQKEEIAHRAEKRGVPPSTVVEEIITLLMDQMFDAVTPYR